MADEKNVNNNETTEYEIKKSLLDSFVDLFKRPAALPGEIPSKHKTTNIDMQTSMNFRSFRANIMKSVGNFFQSLSNLTSPKKEETLNKYSKDYINTTQTENTKTNDDLGKTQQPIHIPEQISIKNARKTPIVENIIVDKTILEQLQNSTEETSFEQNTSSESTHVDSINNNIQAPISSKTSVITETINTQTQKEQLTNKKSNTEIDFEK